jgi:hypothetical protein
MAFGPSFLGGRYLCKILHDLMENAMVEARKARAIGFNPFVAARFIARTQTTQLVKPNKGWMQLFCLNLSAPLLQLPCQAGPSLIWTSSAIPLASPT